MLKLSLKKIKDRFSKEIFSVGLDIGTSTIKLAKLKFSKDRAELCNFAIAPNQLDLTVALKEITQPQDIQRVNLSVSGSSTIIRYINFPSMNINELKQALRFEAQQYIPFPISEVNLDGYILKPNLADNKMLVLLVAVKKEFISQRLKLIQDTGLTVNIVDIDSLALINAFNFNYAGGFTGKTIALLNIGAVMSNLNILEEGLPCLSRDIPIAGSHFTQKIAEILGLDFKSTEEIKIKADKETADQIRHASESVLTNLATEIRTSFDYYENQSASSVEKIFLSGGGSFCLGLKDILVNLLGIPIEYWDPLRQINISDSIDTQKIKTLSSQLAIAIGLALRH